MRWCKKGAGLGEGGELASRRRNFEKKQLLLDHARNQEHAARLEFMEREAGLNDFAEGIKKKASAWPDLKSRGKQWSAMSTRNDKKGCLKEWTGILSSRGWEGQKL